MNSLFKFFRIVALLEGLSFVILIFIAMPLKYVAHQPEYVRIVGMIHGLLFVLYILILIYGNGRFREVFGKSVLYKFYFASIFPFATFYMDYKFLKGAK